MVLPFTTHVYKDSDGWYVAKAKNGLILAENNNAPETVIQTAIDRKGLVVWSEGDYDASASFSGLQIKSDTTLWSSPKTKLRVPQGYTGGALVNDPATYGQILDFYMWGGLDFAEQGTAAQNWSALLFKMAGTGGTGTWSCKYGPFNVYNAKNSVCFDVLNVAGWVTSSTFDMIQSSYVKNGINVVQTVAAPQAGISSLTWNDFWFQSGPQTEYGLRAIIGKNWVMKGCAIWDMQYSNNNTGTGVSAQFLPTAEAMLILGGILMHHNPDNQAAAGQVRWIDGHSSSIDFQYVERLYQTNGSLTGGRTYTIPHGMGFTPDWVQVWGASKDALTSPITWTVDSTNIIVTYIGTPPPPSTAGNQNNVKLSWRASVK